MPPVIIDLKRTDDARDVVHRAVQALAEGQLVVFPTETVYGLAASALQPAAVERLYALKGRDPAKPFTLAIKSCDDLLDYVPDLPPLAQRLARRCWPGPLTMVLDDAHPDSLIRELPPISRTAAVPAGTIGVRVPAHPTILGVLRLCAGPLMLTSANLSGKPEAVTATETLEVCRDDVALVLDDGRCRFAQPSSVVRVRDNCWSVLRPGVLNDSSLRQLSSYMILFVCTGNTCRSPMAETLMRDRLARRLGLPREELEQHGVLVLSAGVAALSGARASAEAAAAMAQRGLDLRNHESQPLSERLVKFADVILTMTRGHRDAILSHWPTVSGRVHVLSREGGDIADPIGGPVEMYERCATQIDQQLEGWLDQLDIEPIPNPDSSGG